MLVELLCFVGGSLLILVPGIWLAGALSLGRDRVERWTYGSCIGLALAAYLASAISYFDLRWFYPVWAAAALACLAARWFSQAKYRQSLKSKWIVVILLLVAAARFGIALPQPLPEGPYDPTVHLILAGKIQQTQHAIHDYLPFDSVALNYPTGSHTLLVVLSAITRLPLHAVFKDLIPLLGVLSTAQVYLFARRAAGDESVALWSAGAYGLWAWLGSNDYFRWGGLPNEMGMLFLMTMLTLWLDDVRASVRIPTMGVVFAALILVHHHSMLVAGILLAAFMVMPLSRLNAASSRRILVWAVALALLLDGFFLIPYAMRITTLHSTTVLYDSEPPLTLGKIVLGIGLVNAPLAVAGIVLWVRGRAPRIHPVVFWAAGVLASLFLVTEHFVPLLMSLLKRPSAIAFAPSRFLTDLNYFLPLMAGISVAFIQARLRMRTPLVLALMCCAALADYRQWKGLIRPDDSYAPAGFVEACRWIHDHTSPSTVVLNRDNWTTYLAWRRATFTPLSGSDPIPDHAAMMRHLAAIMSGQTPPDSPDMTIVKILPIDTPSTQAVLWSDSGYKIIQVWPARK
ncbi:MAG: hypothetical protein ABSB33_06825 [Tepidisphaeraceae bacterium]|jgi:hypothetical protein